MAEQVWQPIATAPKDGTFILVGWFGEGWSDHEPPHVVAWRGKYWIDEYNEEFMAGTHWAPLPDPPDSEPSDG